MVTMYLRSCTCIITWYVCFYLHRSVPEILRKRHQGLVVIKVELKIHYVNFCGVKVVWLHYSMTLAHLGLSMESALGCAVIKCVGQL